MMKTQQRIQGRRGSTLVEFAIAVPVVALLLSGAVDFGRVFYNAIAVKSGSATAAMWGSQRAARSGDFPKMVAMGEDDSADASRTGGEISITPAQICSCPDSDPFPCGEYQQTSCSGYGSPPRAYIRVRAQQPFWPIAPIPGVPESNIEQYTWMRVR